MKRMKRFITYVLIALFILPLQLLPTNSSHVKAAVPAPKELSQAEKEFNQIPKNGKVELTEKRTEFTKTYLKSDGSKELDSYLEPVNYKDESKGGQWTEIDSSLKADTSSFGSNNNLGYTNKSNNFKLNLSTDLNQKMFSLTKKNSGVELKPQEILKGVDVKNLNLSSGNITNRPYSVSSGKISYKNVYSDTDFVIHSTNTGVKEDIVLNRYSGKNIFKFDLNLQNAFFVKNPDGSYTFYNQADKSFLFTMPRFYMWDSKGGTNNLNNVISYDVESEITSKNNSYVVTVTADNKYLSDPARVFPVTIDPSFSTLTDLEDTYIQSNYHDARYKAWNQARIWVGNQSGVSYNKGIMRAFILFGIPDLTNARIDSATLSVLQNGCTGASCSNYVDLYLTSQFNPYDIYWDNAANNTIYSYNDSGGAHPYSRAVSDTNWGWLNFDVRQAVADMFKGDPNVQRGGFQLFQTDWGQVGWRTWIATNDPDFGSIGNNVGPRLVVNYTDYNAAYGVGSSINGVAGTSLDIPVTVQNRGRNSWPGGNTALSYHLIDSTGRTIIQDGEKVFLPRDVAPGGDAVSVLAKVKVPSMAGNYTIQWDLIQPGVTWFSAQGISVANQSLSVSLPSFSSSMHMGTEDYYTKMGPVDLATGSLDFSSTDMSIPTDSSDLSITRSYNSSDVTKKYSQDSNGYVSKWLINGLYRDDDRNNRLKGNYLGDDASIRPNEGTSSSNNLWFNYDGGSPYVDLNQAFWQNGTAQPSYFNNTAGYAHTYVYSPSDKDVQLRLGSDDGARVWLDSNLIFEGDYARGAAADQNIVGVHLSKGWHSLMIKVTQIDGGWGFYLRFTDNSGKLISDLTYALNNPDLFQAKSVLGKGWTMNFEEKIYSQDKNNIYYRDGNGTVNLFIRKAPGNYLRPPGVNYNLFDLSDGNYYLSYIGSGMKIFNPDGTPYYYMDNHRNFVYYHHNTKGQVDKIYEKARNINMTYNTNGSLATIKDQLGTTITYAYDSAITPPRFVGLNYPDGTNHRYAFTDTTGYKISKYTDRRGYSTSFAYSDNKVSQINDAMNNITKINYTNQKTEVTDALSRKTTYKFNQANLLTNYTNAKGYEEFYQYDGNYNLVARTPVIPENDRYYYKYSYTYDSKNNLLSETDPLGNTSKYTYDISSDVLTSAVDPKGAKESYAYSSDNHYCPISYTDANGNKTKYGYDGNWRVIFAEDAQGKRTTYSYNDQGDLLSEASPKGEIVTYAYDTIGRNTSEKSPTGKTVQYTYDKLSQLTKVTDPSGMAITYTYDQNGNQTKINLPDSKTRSYTYDQLNRVTKFTDEAGVSISYAYDSVGNQIKVTDANNKATTFQYDELNQMVSQTDPLGNISKVNYDRNGNVSSSQDENGVTANNSYDKTGQLTSSSTPDGKTTIGYDANGNIQTANHNTTGENVAASYDANGNVITASSNISGTNNYNYSSLNQITQSTSATNNVNYSYDANGQLVQVNNSLNGTGVIGSIALTRDTDGKLTSLKKQNGDLTSYLYDSSFRITNVRTASANRTVTIDYNYKYDNSSNIVSESGLYGQVKNYSYDVRDQLIKDDKATYVYDPMGNRKTMTESGKTTTYTYDNAGDANRLTSIVDGNGKTTKYIYDKAGNITDITDVSGGVTKNVYDEDGYFIKSTLPDKTVVEYSYDKLAKLRTQRKQTNPDGSMQITKFVYDGDKLVSETDQNGKVKISYTWDQNENLASFTVSDKNNKLRTYSYLKNAKGDVVGFSDEGGNAIVRYEYDSWGKIIKAYQTMPLPSGSIIDTSMNPRLYGSYWYDTTLKLYFMKTRMYDPSIGRFLSLENSINGNTALAYNPYLYCANNPISRIDPSGKSWWSAITNAVSTAVHWIAKEVTAFVTAVVNVATNAWNKSGTALSNGLNRCASSNNRVVRGVANAVNSAIDETGGNWGKALQTGMTFSVIAVVSVMDIWLLATEATYGINYLLSGSSGSANAVMNEAESNSAWGAVSVPTRAGNYPSWTTARGRYWQVESSVNSDNWTTADIQRMENRLAPQDINGNSYQLHHIGGRNIPDPHNALNLQISTQEEHYKIHGYNIN